jgi:ATP-dependent RNA helicase DeaD
MLRGARIQAQWIDPPTADDIRRNDRTRVLEALLAPVETDEEDRAIAAQLLAERSPQDIAAALVRAHRAAMPQPEDLTPNTPEARQAEKQERHRPGFEDIVWFRMDVGRRHNADARWILPLLCRRGHITRNEIGAIRIGPNETYFQVPRTIADKFASALTRTAGSEDGGDVTIELAPDTPREVARHRAPTSARPKRGPQSKGAPNDGKPRGPRDGNGPKKAWPKKQHRKGPKGS